MLLSRDILIQLTERRIVVGKSTSLWYDPWISGSHLINRLGYQAMEVMGGENLCVDSIILNSEWRVERLPQTRSLSDEIIKIKIFEDSSRDCWIWSDGTNTTTKTPYYNIKKTL